MSAPVLWIFLPLGLAVVVIVTRQSEDCLPGRMSFHAISDTGGMVAPHRYWRSQLEEWTFKLSSIHRYPGTQPDSDFCRPVFPCFDLWLRLLLVCSDSLLAYRPSFDPSGIGHHIHAGRRNFGGAVPVCSSDNRDGSSPVHSIALTPTT